MALTELLKLKALSARLGADPLLVQGAGGNTSLKRNDIMWIKASGKWLMNATEREIFVPLDIPQLTHALAEDNPDCEACLPFVRSELNAAGLRPSIETSVHGLMPQAVVLHVHCVNTIAWAIQQNAEDALNAPLAKFNWCFVPYARPGLQLSRAIRKAMKPGADVLILGNHGLVVAAETVDAAEALLHRVVLSLLRPVRKTPRPDIRKLKSMAFGSSYRLPLDEAVHDFALDAWAHSQGSRNVFYPDHAVFLGRHISDDLASMADAVAVFGAGVLIRKDSKPSTEPMVRCLSDVFHRLEQGTVLKALTAPEINQLLDWDAEKYRQKI